MGFTASVLGHTTRYLLVFEEAKEWLSAMGGLLALMPACLLVGLFVWGLTFSNKYVAVHRCFWLKSSRLFDCILLEYRRGLGKTLLAFVVMA